MSIPWLGGRILLPLTAFLTTRGIGSGEIVLITTMKEEAESRDGFMFVNYDARTKGQGPEAPLRSIKRAYVARQHYRKVRRRHMEAWSSSRGESSTETSAESPDMGLFLTRNLTHNRQLCPHRISTSHKQPAMALMKTSTIRSLQAAQALSLGKAGWIHSSFFLQRMSPY